MSWFTENPWPLLLILAGSAIVALISGAPKARSAAVACALAAIGFYVLESAIVTPAEDLKRSCRQCLNRFEFVISPAFMPALPKKRQA